MASAARCFVCGLALVAVGLIDAALVMGQVPGIAPAPPPPVVDNNLREPPLAMPGTTVPGAGMQPTSVAPPPFDVAQPPLYHDVPVVGLPVGGSNCWTWQLLPDSLLYKSYLAGGKEPRMGSQWVYLRDYGWLWDVTLGARAGILRYGNTDDIWPEGWQLDIEGAAFPRLDTEHARDLVSADFRFGVPLTVRRGHWEMKFGYYHLSSHLGDEYLLSHPSEVRKNYVRDSLVLGVGLRPFPNWRVYYETGYSFLIDGGAQPWELQFGAEYSPVEPSTVLGAPFAATNVHLRQENHFSGNVVVQAGWQWRGATGHLLRIGANYLNGMSDQYQFYNRPEDQLGVGLWYDF